MTDFPTEDVSMEDQAAGMHTGAIREGAARHPFRDLSFFSNFTANNRSAPRSNSMLSMFNEHLKDIFFTLAGLNLQFIHCVHAAN